MRALLTAGLLVLAAASVQAQRWLAPGDRVRVIDTDNHKLAGTLIRVTDQGVDLIADGVTGTLSVPYARIARVDAGNGKGSNAGKGLLIGAASGIGLGVLLGESLGRNSGGDLGPHFATAVLGTFLGAVGAGAGLTFGLLTTSESWGKGALLPRPEVRAGLGLSFRF